MALRSTFFYVCLFIFSGVLGYSIDDVVDKIQNLETKLEVMYETVTQLRTENKNLKTRVEILEELIEHKDAKLQSIQVSEANESNATEAELVLDMLPESSKEIPYRKNLKRIGKKLLDSYTIDQPLLWKKPKKKHIDQGVKDALMIEYTFEKCNYIFIYI